MRRAPPRLRTRRGWAAPDGCARLGSRRSGCPWSIHPSLCDDDRQMSAAATDPTHEHAPGEPAPTGISTRTRPPTPAAGRASAFIGAGRVGTALGVAFAAPAGRSPRWPVATRDGARASSGRSQRARSFERPGEIVDEVDLIFLTVPDDAIARVAGQVRLYSGQAIVHTSGALPASVLEPARAAGTTTGSFHPLVAFADLVARLADLRGATSRSRATSRSWRCWPSWRGDRRASRCAPARRQGRLPRGRGAGRRRPRRPARRASPRSPGAPASTRQERSRSTRRSIRQTLANAERLGIDAALTGPFVRGDAARSAPTSSAWSDSRPTRCRSTSRSRGASSRSPSVAVSCRRPSGRARGRCQLATESTV